MVAAFSASWAYGQSAASPAAATVRGWVTTDDGTRSLEPFTLTVSEDAVGGRARRQVELMPTERYQAVHGFGAALTTASAWCLLKMPAAARAAFLRETFSPTDGFGVSLLRVPIGCSDFSFGEYTLCDTPGLEHFALTYEETDYLIPVLREILAIHPGVKIMATPWTCPLWMKDYSAVPPRAGFPFTGGQLRRDCYEVYARYLVRWVEAFEQAGIPIAFLTMQNEPLNAQNSASMFMGWEEQRDFVKVLGPALREAGLSVRIYAYDHNYDYSNRSDQRGYPLRIYADAEASRWLAGAAFHDYGGHSAEMAQVRACAPDKEVFLTETSIGRWNMGHNLQRTLLGNLEAIAFAPLRHGCSAIWVWNLMLSIPFEKGRPVDKGGEPNRPGGCQSCFGAVDLDAVTQTEFHRNSHYYLMCHFSAATSPGAVRIGTGDEGGWFVRACGFENPDGTYGLVLLNKNSGARTLSVGFPTAAPARKHITVTLPARSVTTLRWPADK